MKFESLQPGEDLDVSTALATVEGMRHEAMALGGNDSEHSEFKRIIEDLQSNILSPKVAISMAQSVLDRKQNYH